MYLIHLSYSKDSWEEGLPKPLWEKEKMLTFMFSTALFLRVIKRWDCVVKT